MVVYAVRNDVSSGAERHHEATVAAVRDIAIVQLRTRCDRTKRLTCTHNSREARTTNRRSGAIILPLEDLPDRGLHRNRGGRTPNLQCISLSTSRGSETGRARKKG